MAWRWRQESRDSMRVARSRAVGLCGQSVRAGRFVTRHGKLHRTTRHDRGNGVLVHHLGHRVAQQHNVLVERFDLTLQFDAVDQVNGHRHMFTPELVQKRVLQELAFVIAHDMFRVQRVEENLPYHSKHLYMRQQGVNPDLCKDWSRFSVRCAMAYPPSRKPCGIALRGSACRYRKRVRVNCRESPQQVDSCHPDGRSAT